MIRAWISLETTILLPHNMPDLTFSKFADVVLFRRNKCPFLGVNPTWPRC